MVAFFLMSKNIHIDLKHLSNIVDGDIEFEKELFKVFIDNGKLNIEKMEISIQENTDESWYACSHAFKGASAAVGAFQLAKILEECQQLTISSKQDKITIIKIIRMILDNEDFFNKIKSI